MRAKLIVIEKGLDHVPKLSRLIEGPIIISLSLKDEFYSRLKYISLK